VLDPSPRVVEVNGGRLSPTCWALRNGRVN
jgi:hypothetical protein